jgi:Lrp/AsnC family leucine-responsive transcriptional regulator
MENLDVLDRKILKILQEDGSITNAELASRVGLTPPPVLERVRRLERDGFIKKYVTLLDPQMVNRGTIVFVAISMAQHSAKTIKQFWKDIQALPEVLECYHIAGEDDYLLKVAVKDIRAYEEFVLHRLTTIPNIGKIRSSFVLSTVKHQTQLPIDGAEE